MKAFTYSFQAPAGIHARPAGVPAKSAAAFRSRRCISKGEETAALNRIPALMGLGVHSGGSAAVPAGGPDEAEAAAATEALFREPL